MLLDNLKHVIAQHKFIVMALQFNATNFIIILPVYNMNIFQ